MIFLISLTALPCLLQLSPVSYSFPLSPVPHDLNDILLFLLNLILTALLVAYLFSTFFMFSLQYILHQEIQNI